MKRFIFAGVSVLLVSVATATAAKAETRIDQNLRQAQMVAIESATPYTPAAVSDQPNTRVENQLSLNPVMTNAMAQSQISAFDLVFQAYQGHFRNQGVPGYGGLISDVYHGQVHAKDLVQAGIDTNRLPASALMDQAYLTAVEANLLGLNSH